MDLTTVTYETCAHCWHFIEPNDAEPGRLFPVAEFVHLDDGEKEHDHDAAPSGDRRMLGRWKATYPELFITYQDGKTGPNSAHFVRPAGNLPARATVPRDVAHDSRPDGTRAGDLAAPMAGARRMIARASHDQEATMPLVFALIALMTWLAASRWLFRRWVRNDSLTRWDEKCAHGRYRTDRDHNICRGRHPLPPAAVAGLAAGAALALPATLFMLAVMRNPPMSRRELAERTARLEAENRTLRQAAELRDREYEDH